MSPQNEKPLATTEAASQGLPALSHGDTSRSQPVGETTASSPAASQGLPETFGRYRILNKLGQGGMGAVYLVHDTQLDRQVALKVPRFSDEDGPQGVERFLREARAAATLQHPNLCPIYDVGVIGGTHYLTMAYIEGHLLSEYIRPGKPAPERQSAAVVRKMALALQEAHAHGIVHRDLKPTNVMLNQRGEPIIMDFGLARRAQRDEVALTQTGAVLGTPAYMAPEQARGQSEAIGPCTDIYALGVILYELLTGQRPFQGEVLQVLSKILTEEPEPPSTGRPGLDPRLEAICLKAMAKNAAGRYASMAELAAALGDFVQQSSDHGSTPGVRPVSASGPRRPRSSPLALLTRLSVRQTIATTIAAGVVFVLVLLGIVLSLRTPEGTLVVEVDEPDATVQVLSEEGKVLVERRSGKGSLTFSVDSGKHRLRLEKDGLEVFAKDFVIASGGKEVIKAILESAVPPLAIAPFDAAKAKEHQKAWAKHRGVPVEYTNALGMKFILIPPGEFTMGSTPAEIEEALRAVAGGEEWQKDWQECIKSEAPQHKVTLTQPFYLGIHEVTQVQYEKVMGQNPSHFAATGPGKDAVVGLDTSTHPVDSVSWYDAVEFCVKLSEKEKLKPFYFRAGGTVTMLEDTGYRLPTEAEWEFACRAGTTTKYWIGDKDDELVRADWFGTNSGGRTHAAGELKANPFGLFDIHGNTLEWVQDWWEPTYYEQFQGKPTLDPNGPSSTRSLRVLRGGHWDNSASLCRASNRYAYAPTGRGGFRVALVAGVARVGRP